VAYQDEESINAELRELTAKSRRLRQELKGFVGSGSGRDRASGLRVPGAKATPVVGPEPGQRAGKKR
jgi:hypothetical protein